MRGLLSSPPKVFSLATLGMLPLEDRPEGFGWEKACFWVQSFGTLSLENRLEGLA